MYIIFGVLNDSDINEICGQKISQIFTSLFSGNFYNRHPKNKQTVRSMWQIYKKLTKQRVQTKPF